MTRSPTTHRLWRALAAFALLALLGPAAHAAPPCQPEKPREVQLAVAEAEDFLAAGAVGDAIESVSRGEAMLGCLTDAVAQSDLGALYLVKGAALNRMGSRTRKESDDAFLQGFVVWPEGDCDVPGITSGGRAACDKIAAKVAGLTAVDFKITGHHGNAAVYVDGIRYKPAGKGEIPASLPPGRHLVQVQSQAGFTSQWVEVAASAAEWSLAPILGEASPEAEAPRRGSLRLEGLPPDAQVVVDGRERRDLPVLTQLDPGDHYVKVASPSKGMMGFNVGITAGQETVYAVVFEGGEPRGGGEDGGGGPRLSVIASYGVAGLAALGAGGTLGLSAATYGRADQAYKTYTEMTEATPDAVAAQYDEAAGLQLRGDRYQLMGLGLAGVAVVGGGVGTLLLLRGDEDRAASRVHILPVAAAGADGRGAVLSLTGTF